MSKFSSALSKYISWEQVRSVLVRFPLSVLSLVVATAAATYLLKSEYLIGVGVEVDEKMLWAAKFFFSAFIGILLFTGASLLSERHRLRSWLFHLLGLVLLYAIFFNTDADWAEYMSGFPWKFFMMFVGSLAFLFAAPYVAKGDNRGFWFGSFKVLVLALFALFCASILAAGLNLAILSVETLFNVYWLDETDYMVVNAFAYILVAGSIFLITLPKDWGVFDKMQLLGETILRRLAYFLAFPLLGIYGLILVAYIGKIIVTGVWPNGFVATPILIYSIAGYVSYVVFSVLRDKQKNLLNLFYKVFPWTVIVLSAVYFIALGQRIEQYGLTELRYLALVAGLLITGFSIYFGVFKNTRLKCIPLTIAIVALILSSGPLALRTLPENCQVSRLEKILVEHGLLVDGMIVKKGEQEVDMAATSQIYSVLEYLAFNHDYQKIGPWFGGYENLEGKWAGDVMGMLGLETPYTSNYGNYFYFNSDYSAVVDVQGYDYNTSFYLGSYDSFPFKATLPNGETLDIGVNGDKLYIMYNAEMTEFPIFEWAEEMKGKTIPEAGFWPREELSFTAEKSTWRATASFNDLSFEVNNGTTVLSNGSGWLLIDLK